MRPHDILQAQVLVRLSAAGYFAWPHPSGTYTIPGTSRRIVVGRKGQADIIACRPPDGHLVGIEIKTGTGRQSADQRRWQRALEAAGGTYLVVRHLEDLDHLLAT